MQDAVTTITAYHFSQDSFLRENEGIVAQYIDMRARMYHPRLAFVHVFGSEYDGQYLAQNIEAIESTQYFRERFHARRDALKISDLVTERTAIEDYLSISRNPLEKGATRVAAMRELNALMGLTVIDEKGNSKRPGMSLDDFYKTHGTGMTASEFMSRHPNGKPRASSTDDQKEGGQGSLPVSKQMTRPKPLH